MVNVLKVGQIVLYTIDGSEYVGEITRVSSSWVYVEADLIRNTWVIKVLQDVQAPSRVVAPQQRQEKRSQGIPDAELDSAHRSLMIDYALDTGDRELFMRLTTSTLVGSTV